jgi:hypothetical protein
MTENASCRNPMCFLGSLRFEDWAQEASDRGGEEGEEGKIKRTGVRELAARQRSRNLCLHIGF